MGVLWVCNGRVEGENFLQEMIHHFCGVVVVGFVVERGWGVFWEYLGILGLV